MTDSDTIPNTTPTREADILRGGPAIRRFVNEFFDPPLSQRAIYRWVEENKIPAAKSGGELIASKTAIRARITGKLPGARVTP
jgi:hypothetical protein